MFQSWNNWCWKLQLGTSLTISGSLIALSGNYALAQSIVPDSTLGAESSTVIKPDANTDEIRGGAIRGKNLFHSFEKFSVPKDGVAHFQNADNIQNIITRVTGESISNIDGTLKAEGTANLFLLNPNGIISGQDARLDIGGSFVASTASSLAFADKSQFSATEPQTQPLLTVSVPMGLQFGTGSGRIVNQSVTDGVGLQVQPGKTLALVGGDVALTSGYLTAGGNLTEQAGRIELGSVAGPSVVSLTPTTDQGWKLGYEGVQNFRDIQLSQGASVNASGDGGGNIQVQGRRVSVRDGSVIAANNVSLPGGTLEVNASESVELIGISGLRTETYGPGAAGDVSITTGKLIVQSGAFVSTYTGLFGDQAQGGDLEVTASDSVELSGTGTSPDGEVVRSSLVTATIGPGNAGDLTIETGKLSVRDGAAVTVQSQRPKDYAGNLGNAGNLVVAAGELQLDKGRLEATAASGQGGDIKLHDLDLLLLRKSEISAISGSQDGGGNAGNITIDSDIVVAIESSGIRANAFAGPGANLEIGAQGIFLSADSEVTASGSTNIEGTVEVENTDVLPEELVDVTGLIVQGCSAGGGNVARGQSEFIITGRGGLPPTPREALASEPALVDLGKPIQGQEDNASIATSITPTSSLPNTIVEAQGWVIGPKGEVVLTATAPTVTPHSPWGTPPNCHPS